MSDGHYDAPAYCAICDRPIITGPTCDACNDYDDELDGVDDHLDDVTYEGWDDGRWD